MTSLKNQLAEAQRQAAQEADHLPGYVWAAGGGAATVIVLAVLGLLSSKR